MSCNCNRKHPNGWHIKECETPCEAAAELIPAITPCCSCCCCDCHCHHKPHNDCACTEEIISQTRLGDMETCCDFDGHCHIYETCQRNRFWPEFSHPRFLCCKDLYSEC